MSNSVAYVIKPIHKQYPPFGVQMQTTDISPSEIKFNISAKMQLHTICIKQSKIQTFSTSTITDLNIVPEQSYMYHVVAKTRWEKLAAILYLFRFHLSYRLNRLVNIFKIRRIYWGNALNTWIKLCLVKCTSVMK